MKAASVRIKVGVAGAMGLIVGLITASISASQVAPLAAWDVAAIIYIACILPGFG